MATVTARSQFSFVEIDERLRVWCDRWRYAPDGISRAHAQTAIDQWLDNRLELGSSELVIPGQEVPIELVVHAVA